MWNSLHIHAYIHTYILTYLLTTCGFFYHGAIKENFTIVKRFRGGKEEGKREKEKREKKKREIWFSLMYCTVQYFSLVASV